MRYSPRLPGLDALRGLFGVFVGVALAHFLPAKTRPSYAWDGIGVASIIILLVFMSRPDWQASAGLDFFVVGVDECFDAKAPGLAWGCFVLGVLVAFSGSNFFGNHGYLWLAFKLRFSMGSGTILIVDLPDWPCQLARAGAASPESRIRICTWQTMAQNFQFLV